MEPDSTTCENNKCDSNEKCFPFAVRPRNLKFYKDLITNNGKKHIEHQVIERLQTLGLFPRCIKCPAGKEECNVISKKARVVDRMQWICETCGIKQPIRSGTFFFKLQCSIIQTLQIILGWCEDVDCEVLADYFGVKMRVVYTIYTKLDKLAIKEQSNAKLGGEGAVVLAEIYPDCLNRLSPDTTDQPHVHRVLMLADTKHIPTQYQLYVINEDLKKNCKGNFLDSEILKTQVEEFVNKMTKADSFIVSGNTVPLIDGATSIQQLIPHCDTDMQHFLCRDLWRGAVALCSAGRDLCAPSPSSLSPSPSPSLSPSPAACVSPPADVRAPNVAPVAAAPVDVPAAAPVDAPAVAPAAACAATLRKYLTVSLYRQRFDDGFYQHMLHLIAADSSPDR